MSVNCGIIALPEIFTPEHLPLNLCGRGKEMAELLRCLAPSAQGQRPLNIWLCGRTGTGKTATLKAALARHAADHNVRCIYVNCFRTETAYAVLDHILTELRVLRAETPQIAYKARRLMEALGGRPLVVALDEIDRMPMDERESALHLLTEAGKVGLACVSESRDSLFALNPKTVNRVAPVFLEFAPYEADAVHEILADRADVGLLVGSWSHALLERIARLSAGDARVAIQTLRSAAHLADSEALGFVEERHVEYGFQKAQELRREYRLRKLTVHHRVLYEIVKQKGRAAMGEVVRAYLERCKERNLPPVSKRCFNRYVEVLRRQRLLRGEKARVFGNVVHLEVVE